jgi:uncharacterized membrane protein
LTEFDPFPFGLLTMIVSLEAIFLSIFELISQSRQEKINERRSKLARYHAMMKSLRSRSRLIRKRGWIALRIQKSGVKK